ncbi:MAG: 3-dehydroquinate synthase [Acidobacteriota bacterium]
MFPTVRPRKINIDVSERDSTYEITIANGSRADIENWVRDRSLESTSKVIIVSNSTVFDLYGDATVNVLGTANLEVGVWLMEDGEVHKNFDSAECALNAFSQFDLSRTDLVLALGGGVVGDLAGFAASIYLRGVAYLQMPTTLLSMIDSSVGGKTGVNSTVGKNRVGTFYQPKGVLIDTAVLKTLPKREVTAGLCEAIKHGVLSGPTLFNKTLNFIKTYPIDDFPSQFDNVSFQIDLDSLIEEQLSYKASIVRADERESVERIDAGSRKILNFGHTLAHALEKITGYKYFKHGEAVGYGILYAAELSKMLDLIDNEVVSLLYDVVHRTGSLPTLTDINPEEVFEAFRFDKKVVGGSLQMILIKGIGKPLIVDAASIPHSTHIRALNNLLKRT